MISFTSDTCSVMKGVRNGVISKLREQQPKIIDIHCICHLVSLVVKAAVKTLPLKMDDLPIDIFYHFHHSVKRVSLLSEYADFFVMLNLKLYSSIVKLKANLKKALADSSNQVNTKGVAST